MNSKHAGGHPRLVLAAMIVTAVAVGGCERHVSSRDVVKVDSGAALKVVHGKSKLLGLGSTSGAWIDPRPAAEFAKGHIPGAINIPFVDFEDVHKHRLDGLDALVVYGDDYNDWRAEGMAKRLMSADYKDVLVLQGGLRAWTASGNAVDTGS